MSLATTQLKRIGASLTTLALTAALAWGQEHGAEAGGEHAAGGAHAAGGEHAIVNPLAEHQPWYYSLVGLGVAAAILIVFATRSRNLSVRNPSRGQLLAEQAVASMQHFCRGAIGAGGEKFTAFVGTLFAFVLCSNLCGVLPFYLKKGHEEGAPAISFTPAPSANLSMTLALGAIVFVLFNVVGIKANGIKNYLAHFAGPLPALAPLLFPIEIIGVIVRPISLGMRLFGNIFGEETVIAVLVTMSAATFIVPLHAPMLAFGVFGAVVQAGVFSILACSYIALAIGEHDHDHGHGHDEHGHGHESPAHQDAAHAH
jgi:F-type H+-transporting ATPase subunit a